MTKQHSFAAGSTQTAGRVLVDALQKNGVERVFCVPGESYLEVLDALYDATDIELITAKHEGAAANMAEADGKLTGKPGICMVTRGPGAMHASIGLHIAQQDSTPMILFIGQVPTDQMGREAFQEMDYKHVFGSVAKLVIEVDDASRMAELVAKAFRAAQSGRPGPVVVSLPEDVLTTISTIPACAATTVSMVQPDELQVQELISKLSAAKRPLVLLGGSCWSKQGTAALKQFVETWNLPVAAAFRRQDLLDNNNPQYVGHLSLGMSPALKKSIQESDLIIAIGTRLGEIATDAYTLLSVPKPVQPLIHCHVDDAELGRVYQADLAIHCAPSALMQALNRHQPTQIPPWESWTQQARHAFEQFTTPVAPSAKLTGVDLGAVIQHISETAPDDAIITNGAGNYTVWLHRFYRYRTPYTELASTCGAMGYGVPAAIAAALRFKGKKEVLSVAGDGCFMMYPQELATAVEFGAKLIVIVVNNGVYGTIRMHQERDYPGRVSGTALQGPDYVKFAESFGAKGIKVTQTEQFAGALQQARAHDGVTVIELVTDPLQLTPEKRMDD